MSYSQILENGTKTYKADAGKGAFGVLAVGFVRAHVASALALIHVHAHSPPCVRDVSSRGVGGAGHRYNSVLKRW